MIDDNNQEYLALIIIIKKIQSKHKGSKNLTYHNSLMNLMFKKNGWRKKKSKKTFLFLWKKNTMCFFSFFPKTFWEKILGLPTFFTFLTFRRKL